MHKKVAIYSLRLHIKTIIINKLKTIKVMEISKLLLYSWHNVPSDRKNENQMICLFQSFAVIDYLRVCESGCPQNYF